MASCSGHHVHRVSKKTLQRTSQGFLIFRAEDGVFQTSSTVAATPCFSRGAFALDYLATKVRFLVSTRQAAGTSTLLQYSVWTYPDCDKIVPPPVTLTTTLCTCFGCGIALPPLFCHFLDHRVQRY